MRERLELTPPLHHGNSEEFLTFARVAVIVWDPKLDVKALDVGGKVGPGRKVFHERHLAKFVAFHFCRRA